MILPVRSHAPVRLSCSRWILLVLLGFVANKNCHVQAQAEAAATTNIFQAIFDLFFKCGVIPAEGCGILGLGAVVRATEDPNAPGCVEKCSLFPGLLSPDYFCGSCGEVSPPIQAPVSPPFASPVIAPVPAPVVSPPTPGLVPGFQMTLDLQILPQFKIYFTNSAARWERVIVGDLPDWSVSNRPELPDNRCSYPAIIDDLYVCVFGGDIDGVGKTAGFAGALARRSSGDRLPVIAYAKFEEADIPEAVRAVRGLLLLCSLCSENQRSLVRGSFSQVSIL
jgi:hypothetical protein